MSDLFGTDGIRGIVGKSPLTIEFFLKIGRAAGEVLVGDSAETKIIVGQDTRVSGQMLKSALTAGLLSSGVNVIDAGIIPTPGIAWLVKKLQFDAGAVISASHNPVDQNGVKFFNLDGNKLTKLQEERITKLIQKESNLKYDFKRTPGDLINGNELSELYIQALIKEHPKNFLNGIDILIDCSNGAASKIAPKVFYRAGANITVINSSPTGININVDCGSEFIRRFPSTMGENINRSNSTIGLAFDGDGDRVVFVEPNGKLLDGDHILGFLGNYLHKRDLLLSNAIVTTSMRNEGFHNYIKDRGIKMYETPVGDKYVVEKLQELVEESGFKGKIGLGGEQAGHIILLNDEFSTGDGIRTALYTLRAFVESGDASFIEFASSIKKTPQIIASAFVGDGPRFTRAELDEIISKELKKHSNLSRLNLRYSGTEPIFRTMIESNHELNELNLADISIELSREAQLRSGIDNGEIDILNCTKGGLIDL